MLKKLYKNPTFTQADGLAAICKPLSRLNINYFGHAHINQDGQLAVLTNNPGFTEHYFRQAYYNADIHLGDRQVLGDFVLWDAIERFGLSEKMHTEAAGFGVQHTFTIIENKPNGNHYYHFASDSSSLAINQVYLNNIDLLRLFISHFNDKVSKSRELHKAYDIKFTIDDNAAGFTMNAGPELYPVESMRSAFIKTIKPGQHVTEMQHIIHKDTSELVILSPQQIKCLMLSMQGYSSKQIADRICLSARTIENYLQRIRRLLGCRSGKELFAAYFPQIQELLGQK